MALRLARITLTALLATVCAIVFVSPASADDDLDPIIAATQEPLQDATDAIEDQIAQHPEWISRYGGAEISVANKRALFYWKREPDGSWSPPSELFLLVASYDNNTTVNTALAASQYSVAELKSAAEAAGTVDSDVVAVALEPDSSGLVVEMRSAEAANGGNQKLSSARSGVAGKAASPTLRYVKRYEAAEAPVEAVAVRQNDSSASPGWKGGARLRWPVTGGYMICSSSFGVVLSGFEYMITAAHCIGSNNTTTQDGNGDTMGPTTNRTPGNDYMWVKVGNASNRVYVGAWNSSTGSYRNVVGTVGNTSGTYTCQSGASSGTNCDTKIINENYFYNINGINQWGVRAERQSNATAIGTGDSGGPVLKNTSTTANIKAAGVISAGQVKLTCGSVAPGTRCFKRVIYKRIQTARWTGTVVVS